MVRPFTDIHAAVAPTVAFASGSGYELLIGLYARARTREAPEATWATEARLSTAARAAVDAVGDHTGEVWLHLLGLAVELEEPSADALVAAAAAADPRELRLLVLGYHVPAWRLRVEPAAIEAAADGDDAAQEALLARDDYYAGAARRSLSTLMRLGGPETQEVLVAALDAFRREALAPAEEDVAALLAADVAARAAGRLPWHETIAEATGGFSYVPEPGLDRVLLVPHVAGRPGLLLCQHRTTRVVCYPLEPDVPEVARLARGFAALGDETRLRILRALAREELGVSELARRLGIAKSTVHHHLAALREAGHVTLAGHQWRYRYLPRRGAAPELGVALESYLYEKEE